MMNLCRLTIPEFAPTEAGLRHDFRFVLDSPPHDS